MNAETLSSPKDANLELQAIGRRGLSALIEIIPRAAWAGIKGAVGGFFLFGLIGGAFALVSWLVRRWLGDTTSWLTLTLFVLMPLAFALAGLWSGAIRGAASKVAEELAARKAVVWLYAIIKPACSSALRKVSGRTVSRDELMREVDAALSSRLSASEAEVKAQPASFSERVARFLAMNSRRVFCLGVVHAALSGQDGAGAVANVEKLGLERVEQLLADLLGDWALAQLVVSVALAILVCAVPIGIHVFTR